MEVDETALGWDIVCDAEHDFRYVTVLAFYVSTPVN